MKCGEEPCAGCEEFIGGICSHSWLDRESSIPPSELLDLQSCDNCKHKEELPLDSDEILKRIDQGIRPHCQSCIRNQPYPDLWEKQI